MRSLVGGLVVWVALFTASIWFTVDPKDRVHLLAIFLPLSVAFYLTSQYLHRRRQRA